MSFLTGYFASSQNDYLHYYIEADSDVFLKDQYKSFNKCGLNIQNYSSSTSANKIIKITLLPLNGPWWFGGDVVSYSVDASDFVDYSV